MSDKHIFAFYSDDSKVPLDKVAPQTRYLLQDKMLCSRIITVLRLQVGDELILFDKQVSTPAVITTIDAKKNCIQVLLHDSIVHVKPNPSITLYQALTQKSAFEDIVYSATQMGATAIVPVITAKTQRKWGDEKELERLHKMVIAAAEQSKNFWFPQIHAPVSFEQVCTIKNDHNKIFFSVHGKKLIEILKQNDGKSMSVFIGAEAGLTDLEEQQLQSCGWHAYRLTPSILRAVDAVIVGLGALRACL